MTLQAVDGAAVAAAAAAAAVLGSPGISNSPQIHLMIAATTTLAVEVDTKETMYSNECYRMKMSS